MKPIALDPSEAIMANNKFSRTPTRNRNGSSRRKFGAKGARISLVLALFVLLVAVLPSPTCSESIWRKLRAGSHRSSTTATAVTSPSALSVAEDTATGGRNTSTTNDKNTTEVATATTATTTTTTTTIDNTEDDNEERRSNRKLFSRSRKVSRHRQQFLERVALTSELLQEAELLEDSATTATANATQLAAAAAVDLEAITPQSDLRRPGRHIHVVTTAALPWFTGTAVNPLLRAAYLHRRTQEINNAAARNGKGSQNQQWVTLVIPWLELPEDQETLYGGRVFADPQEQEDYIRSWLRDEAGLAEAADPASGLEILFYPARYHAGLGSIFAMGDIMDTVLSSSSSSGAGAGAGDRQLDVCVLEEPEHCNWYRAPGDSWTKRFNYVVGIVHTNYKEYAQAHYSGLWTAPAIALMSSAMVRAYCHKVIKLSDTLQSYAVEKETTSNVHGVRSNFWREGTRRASEGPRQTVDNSNATQVYFIGKLLWAKGLDIMLELEDYYKQYTGNYFALDLYGNGPDQRAIMRAFHGRRNSVNANPKEEAELEAEDGDADEMEEITLTGNVASNSTELASPAEENSVRFSATKQKLAQFKERTKLKTKKKIAKLKDSINAVELPQTLHELIRRKPIPATFPGRVDHGELTDYKIFLNPSTSEVLCTTTAEALAMGKFAIIPVHPSNTFFLQFPNCLAYRNKFEFVANLRWALTHDPEPLTEEQARQFTWEAATDRFLDASAITWRQALERERLGMHKLDERIAWFHNELGKGSTGDLLRKVLGAGPASHQVKYQRDVVAAMEEDESESEESSSDDEEDEGISAKLRRSSFAQAIRETLNDPLSSFSIQ